MLAAVIDLLSCPQCAADLELVDGAAECDRGHRFDIARQGYVSLISGGATKFTGDSAEMIAARARLLGAGHFGPLMDAVTRACATTAGSDPARIVEIGAGTGQYLAHVVDSLPDSRAIALDVSKFAARRAAKVHERIGSIVADVWQPLPIRGGALSHVLCVFAPRNGPQSHRVLAEDGALVVLTPTDRHLRELIDILAMVRVDDRKVERLESSMAGYFERVSSDEVEFTMSLSHQDVLDLVGMGPSARHLTPADLAAAVAKLPQPSTVTASATVSTYRKI
ncbi:methyltransferase type 11 [Rhodococcus sp. D-46]|jgi:23S rRNA (guanine745-N1)-methyltransferase|uniref:putative RNA methyltransferase n=1 Tax=Rhodococcus TaxID=1827 RepID=UPI0013F66822|nr:methyltransferase type 11 [Rhodococcus qingshengii]MCQ4149531.1 methyltransferase type 11 [Rhodococcus qingshengii]NHE68049.1 methyltransferase type 11 [Rhodococcus sp. D-46]